MTPNILESLGAAATSKIPGSAVVDLGPRKGDEPGGNEEFPHVLRFRLCECR